jgi:hypothetical protein
MSRTAATTPEDTERGEGQIGLLGDAFLRVDILRGRRFRQRLDRARPTTVARLRAELSRPFNVAVAAITSGGAGSGGLSEPWEADGVDDQRRFDRR